MSRPVGERPLWFVGDVHLERDDPALASFLDFLDEAARRAGTVVLLGDLFNIWIGGRELEQDHQRQVIDRLVELRAAGLCVRYVEGNRDYGIGRCYVGTAFDSAGDAGAEERSGDRRFVAIHGDLANPSDRQYRAWRAVSRSGFTWGLFRMMPGRLRVTVAEWLESRMRGTNLAYKRELPEQPIRAYAGSFVDRGFDAVVLGHFHVERALDVERPGRRGRVYILPEWRESRRHLEVSPGAEPRFVDSG